MDTKKAIAKKQTRLALIGIPKLVLLLALAGMAFSCNSKKDDKPVLTEEKKDKSTNEDNSGNGGHTESLIAATRWPSFKLDSTDIVNIIASADKPLEFQKNKSVVLKHLFIGIEGDIAVVKLMAFGSEKHSKHGKNSNLFQIRDTAVYVTLTDTVILGNNYINWEAISQAIFYTSGTRKGQLKNDFGYILFTPVNTYDGAEHPTCLRCKGNLWYKISMYKKSGGTFPFTGGGGSSSTNPSPPADPTP